MIQARFRSLRVRVFVVIILIVTVVFLLSFVYRLNDSSRKAMECRDLLKHLTIAVQMYKELHGGRLPSQLKDLPVGNTEALFTCPSVKEAGKVGGLKIVDWNAEIAAGSKVDDNFPLVYDSSIINHQDGINFMTIGGHIIWDKNGEIIQRFMRQYPASGIFIELQAGKSEKLD